MISKHPKRETVKLEAEGDAGRTAPSPVEDTQRLWANVLASSVPSSLSSRCTRRKGARADSHVHASPDLRDDGMRFQP